MKRRNWMMGALCVLLLAAAAAGEEKAEYMALFMGGKKMGHVKHTRQAAGDRVTTTEEMVLSIARMGIEMKVQTLETAVETAEGRPISFKSVMDMGILGQTVEGTVGQDGAVEVTVTSGQRPQKKTTVWPEGALLAEGMRLLSAKMGLKEGTKYTAKLFSPSLLDAMEAEVVIGGRAEVDLLGRVVTLTETKTVMKAPGGQVEATSYVDDECNALKTIMPVMGMQMEMVSCSREVALSPSDPLEFFDRVVIESPAPLTDVKAAKAITYYIQPTGKDAALAFVSSASQSVAKRQDGNMVVIVAPVAAPQGAAFPYRGDDEEAQAAVKPTRHLESDAKEIVGLAKVAAGSASDVADAAARIESYVSKYIRSKNLSVGYATALETAKSRQGDCTEHAVLAAAMCRALGIPARVVMGVTYIRQLGDKTDVFVPHAWFRVYAGGKWIDYDAALKGYDAGHVAMSAGDGEPIDFFGIVGTLGNFRIARVAVER